MKKILVLGAGKSSSILIDYLIRHAADDRYQVHVADLDIRICEQKIAGSAHAQAHIINPDNPECTSDLIKSSDLVVSMLPPALHGQIARICLREGKHFINASYLTREISDLDQEARERGLMFCCEMGLDPGIDHMSAMELIDDIHASGGVITSFRSHCGGLVAPESDDNPWHYKISWNPRNVVMAGLDGAVFRENGQIKKVDYYDLFDAGRTVEIPGMGKYAWYPNRDSLAYIPVYGLQTADSFVRTTLRHPDFCFGWRNLIELGFTDDQYEYDTNGLTVSSFFQIHFDRFGFSDWLQRMVSERFEDTNSHLQDLIRLLEADSLRSLTDRNEDQIMLVDEGGGFRDLSKSEAHRDARKGIASSMHEAKLILSQLFYLGLDSSVPINQGKRTAAQILQWIIEKKWALKANDRDMIIMLHEITYQSGQELILAKSSLVMKGEDSIRTAMAKTVGLPLGIAARMILNEKIHKPGVHIPTSKDIYGPVLRALEQEGVKFSHFRQPVG
jgi:saccharopine dehydrogenase-like NADP-dependent oxidoreductase